MQALQIQRFGAPAEALRLIEYKEQPLTEGDIRIQIKVAGINPSDVINAKGAFSSTTLPRIIGRDFAGVVIEGPPEWIGREVWGSGGDLGFTRDGTHAQIVDIPRTALAEKPSNLSFEEAAAVGVPFTAAYKALEGTRLERGNRVIVTGAAGAVGRAAIELIHARGGSVIALVKDAADAARLSRKKVNATASSEAGNLAEVVRSATDGRGADIALNGVGASVGTAIIPLLAEGGRMAIYGAAFGGREMQLDLMAFYRNRLELIGVNTSEVDATKAAAILNELKPLYENGTLDRPEIAERYPLASFVRAYDRVAASAGKIVFVIS